MLASSILRQPLGPRDPSTEVANTVDSVHSEFFTGRGRYSLPRGSTHTTIMELSPNSHAMYGVSALIPEWHYIWTLLSVICAAGLSG